MSGLADYLLNTLSNAIFRSGSTTELDMATSFYDSERYTPSTKDVYSVKSDLVKKFALPIELVDTVVDFAEYWPRTTTCRTGGEFHLRSYPLGYIPDASTSTTCPMAAIDAVSQTYPTIAAQPFNPHLNSRHHDDREDVFSKWTDASQIRGEHPCRKVVFTIVSHDQGWGGGSADRGTYKGSFTWFEVGKETIHPFKESAYNLSIFLVPMPLVNNTNTTSASVSDPMIRDFPMLPKHGSLDWTEGNEPVAYTIETITPKVHESSPDKFEHPLLPTMQCLQKNLTASKPSKEHKIVWSCLDDVADPDSVAAKALEDQGRGRETANGVYVREMKVGDIVTIWAKARFPGWVNVIEKVQIDVYYAV
ncbi:hypothetical protein QTJ16_005863 [Diplocarpon rosae]|uniref:Uncharacterized protein n=1 Tax=Diplocarpon rosae TaxID=946125 RepID=A0AAD9SVZ8_9HELO|nr:hypothetical protein QTJ16_005863 [Diplocarpon rosae]PBP18856.1 hypothetical protein BUE80_DR010394 [Diplocarpon rosae]